MAKAITKKQLWLYGLHLEWVERWGLMPFDDDVDMSAEVAGIEQAVAQIIGRRWQAGLDNEE